MARRKITEWAKNLSVEVLAANNQWATMDEMETVVPHHLQRYKDVLLRCKSYPLTSVSAAELTFATRFVSLYLFTRVKGSRPMTYQYLTLSMFEKSKESDGFVDQTEFKTAQQYTFDSLIFDETSTRIIDEYIVNIRPLLNPKCDYLLVTRSGTQFKAIGNHMSELVFQAIGKYVHPTRYRQIVETESSRVLSTEEQRSISLDQKHSSQVARTYYQKRSSREVATSGKLAMKKLRSTKVEKMVKRAVFSSESEVSDNENNKKADGEDDSVETVVAGIRALNSSCESEDKGGDVPAPVYQPPVRKASKAKGKPIVTSRVPYTKDEDYFLKKGLKIYGYGNWASMLRDPRFKFNEKRSADSLKKRADLLTKIKKH